MQTIVITMTVRAKFVGEYFDTKKDLDSIYFYAFGICITRFWGRRTPKTKQNKNKYRYLLYD